MNNPNKPYTVYMHKLPANISDDKMPKYYIGITCRPVEIRWGNCGDGYQTQPFYRAIKKYGWENFEHIVLEENLSLDDARDMEIKLIKTYNSKIGLRGYNCTDGGEGQLGRGEIPVYCVETGIAYRSSAFAERMTGTTSRFISRRCQDDANNKQIEIKKGNHWCYVDRMMCIHNGGSGKGGAIPVADLTTGIAYHSMEDLIKIYGGDRRTRVLSLEKYYRRVQKGQSLYGYGLRLKDYLMLYDYTL